MSQTTTKFNVNQYQNNHEQGQLLPGDGAKIKQNHESNQNKNKIINMFKANFVIKLIALSLFIGIILKYWTQKKQDLAKRKIQTSQVEYLKIATQQKMVKLAYLKSVVDRPRSLPQPPIKLITILNTQDFKQFSTSMGSTFQFSTKLYMNWFEDKELFYQVEYSRLNTKYKLDSLVPEKGICVVTTFNDAKRDEENASWKMFMKSINQQNYSNYRVYIIDDFSSINTTRAVLNEAHQYPRLNNRLWIVKNLQKIGTLGSKDSVIRNLCQPGQIVIEIDGYDALIGKQTFNLFNRFYNTSQNAWFVYTNFLTMKKDIEASRRSIKVLPGQIDPGSNEAIKEDIFAANSYRTAQIFVTSQLRSFYRDLYMKIPLSHLLERGTGRYFMQASDKLISYALAELAGPNHTFFYPEFNYFSYEPNQQKAVSLQDCTIPILQRCEYQARILTPLKPLKQLADKVELTQEYHIPERVMRIYAQKQQIETECIQKQSGVSKIFEDGL